MEVIAEQSDKTTHKLSPLDDLVLYCLDMLCPCDINFITNHMDTRWEAGSVEAGSVLLSASASTPCKTVAPRSLSSSRAAMQLSP